MLFVKENLIDLTQRKELVRLLDYILSFVSLTSTEGLSSRQKDTQNYTSEKDQTNGWGTGDVGGGNI